MLLLEHQPEKIDWWYLSDNPNAIPLLEKHPEKIDWSLSRNPNAIPLLEKHPEKIDWRELSKNPNAMYLLSSLDCQKMKEKNKEFAEELCKYVFEPQRMWRIMKKYTFDLDL